MSHVIKYDTKRYRMICASCLKKVTPPFRFWAHWPGTDQNWLVCTARCQRLVSQGKYDD